MKDPKEIEELVKLDIDYIGFNFYDKSQRYISSISDDIINIIPKHIVKTGVFVNASLDDVIETARKYRLDMVQLHGDESAGYCKFLYVNGIKVIKAFLISEEFDTKTLNQYETHCSYFLFDNKSNRYGGSGKKFDWDILKKFDNTKLPYFLRGGVSPEDVESVKELKLKKINMYGVDINSKFETAPGRKDVDKIEKFIKELKA